MVETSISHSGLGYLVAVEGLSDTAEEFGQTESRIRQALRMSINTTARKSRTEGSRLIRQEVAFPARYLDSRADGRLALKRQATNASLEAVIEGRFEPTSLARFTKSRTHGKKEPTLQVKPGRTTVIPRSFVMNLANGNVGLAIRLKPGETLRNRRKAVAMSRRDSNLVLLYGPSVDQVFRSVSGDMAPEVGGWLEEEFLRQMERLENG